MFEKKEGENNLNPNQEKGYGTEDIPIHTMKKDLQNIGNPESKNTAGAFASQPVFANVAQISSEKKNNSPFLNQEQAKSPGKGMASGEKTNWQKLILIATFIFFLLACGAGGYYFWITKFTNQNQTAPETLAIVPQPQQEEALTFSIEKPNYLSLDTENSDSAKIRETIEKYADKVSASGALTPVEFIVTDAKNNPVGFETFASKIGISFLPDLFSSLNSDEFRFFIYNDSGRTRFGLVIDSKDTYKLKTALLQEELTFPKDMEALLQNIPYDLTGKKFGSGSYANTEIRYINLTSQNDLTIDYAIFQNKLVIGTTKMTIQSIMDYINNHSATKNSTDATNSPNLAE